METGFDTAIFADMDRDEPVLWLTTNIMLTRDFSVQLSGQGYISGMDCGNYRGYRGANYEPYSVEELGFKLFRFESKYFQNF